MNRLSSTVTRKIDVSVLIGPSPKVRRPLQRTTSSSTITNAGPLMNAVARKRGLAELIAIGVTPVNPSLAAGRTRQFTATGTFSDTTTLDLTASVTWSSTLPAFATVSNAAGSNGLATAVAVGTTEVRAISGLISGATNLTVTSAELVSIGVTPAAPSVAKGRTQQFTATGVFSDATIANLTASVTWSTTVGAVATVSNAAGSQGLVTTLDVGATNVVAEIAESPARTA